ncbi:MAG: glycosyltransferase family 4 protein, partial [Candidatus Bathyarchaeota archaeon]
EWYEPFGMTILESFALGKPVVGAKIGGIQELIDNERTGMLFKSGNVEDLAEKMNYLLNNKELTAEMGMNARKEVEERYNENIHYEMLMEAYKKVL